MDTRFCPACGFRTQEGDRFCRGCGDALTDDARASGPIAEAEALVSRGQLEEAVATMQRAWAVVTDSGGLQEEVVVGQ